jgi:mono/diheme cytochrome c family protein
MRIRYGITAVIVLFAVVLAECTPVTAAEEQSPENRQLLVEGARLWPVYCAQCHNARPGSQFSPSQWDAITMHMKTLSNMPAKDMRAIKGFLKVAR